MMIKMFNCLVPNRIINRKRNLSNKNMKKGYNSNHTTTPKINFKNQGGKIKLRDRRILKMAQVKKNSGNNLVYKEDISPTLNRPNK